MIRTVPATDRAPIPIRGTADPADPASVTDRTDAAPQRGQCPALGRVMAMKQVHRRWMVPTSQSGSVGGCCHLVSQCPSKDPPMASSMVLWGM